MEKAWVWLPRASLEYFEGATGFVTASARRLGDPTEILCPCTHCRNLSHQVLDKVTEHLVIRGMDKKYMRSSCWSLHGERRSDMNDSVPQSETEAYGLLRTAYFDSGEPDEPPSDDTGGEPVHGEPDEDSEFRKKLRDAETPLYLTCSKHTKVSAIMALYRIKLLSALHDMLPEGNVLPKSTDSIKKFLKIFGFGYEMIHACKNDCILYRKQYEELETCPRCSASRWEIDKHSNEEKKGIPAKDTPNRWLKFSRKYVYLGNRKRLSPGHHYRRRKGWFDNTVEKGTANRIQTGAEIFATLKNFRNDFGRSLAKKKKRKRNVVSEDEVAEDEENDETSDQWRWKKRSIFFDLPYWKDLPVRHNIDVMHVEKNLSDALLSTLMQSAKSKDGLKARQDLEDIGIRKNLHTQVRGKRFYLPPATYWLSKEEKKIFCQRLSAFRGPDGYCGNIANVVSINPPMIGSLKSHDHHVLIQNLLPAALRGLLPRGPRVAVTRVCNYFNRLCQRAIDAEKLITLENEFVETMCQLERFFPPSLFDIMFHLPLHLAREARLGGPVHFRWMYPFERFVFILFA
ncbi:hypothetical protein YC2023_072081 [Brassica napus]